MNMKKLFLLFIFGVAILLIALAFVAGEGGISIPGLEDNGDVYDCQVTVRADPLSKNNLVDPISCDFTGDTCRSTSFLSIFNPFEEKGTITLQADNVRLKSKAFEQTTLTKVTYTFDDLCIPQSADTLTVHLFNNDKGLDDSEEVNL